MLFEKLSRPFGRAMQIPEESGMQVRVNGPPTVQSSAVMQVRGKLKLLSKKKWTSTIIKWFEKIVNF